MPSTLHSIEQRYLDRKTSHTMRLGQRSMLEKQVIASRLQRTDIQSKILLYTKTQELLLKASESVRTLVQAKVENLVTLALVAVTGDPYQFKMELNKHSGNYSIEFRVINPHGISLDPINSVGGGITDICSMALRIAILELYEPRIEGGILLDEGFKYLSKDHIRTAIEWIQMLVQTTGRQIILVTHQESLALGADKCMEVRANGDTSVIMDLVN